MRYTLFSHRVRLLVSLAHIETKKKNHHQSVCELSIIGFVRNWDRLGLESMYVVATRHFQTNKVEVGHILQAGSSVHLLYRKQTSPH